MEFCHIYITHGMRKYTSGYCTPHCCNNSSVLFFLKCTDFNRLNYCGAKMCARAQWWFLCRLTTPCWKDKELYNEHKLVPPREKLFAYGTICYNLNSGKTPDDHTVVHMALWIFDSKVWGYMCNTKMFSANLTQYGWPMDFSPWFLKISTEVQWWIFRS